MINKKWDEILKDEFNKEYFKKLGTFVKNEYKNKICYPNYSDIFNALRYTDYDEVRVVILGQDPYHDINQAHGLSFSVKNEVKAPPSLRNIFKELENDLGIVKKNNDLTPWTKQGVLLLNSIMTVEKDKPLSHVGKGWEIFTDNIIKELNKSDKPIIFVLWGSYARGKKELISNTIHHIIESVHPSPLSANRGFLGSKPFSKINKYLKQDGFDTINW